MYYTVLRILRKWHKEVYHAIINIENYRPPNRGRVKNMKVEGVSCYYTGPNTFHYYTLYT